ncbi:MAG: phosphodiester glycosidase family protein [Leptolyngbyaceae cyanobacterium SM1_4_3]|nr:phosphodiester glycosidase family protein [Leptolyngbyaceae cyanobacterium SM1_4_3]
MKKKWLTTLALAGFGFLLFVIVSLNLRASQPAVQPELAAQSEPVPSTIPVDELRYEVYTLPQSVVHTLLIPVGERFTVVPAIAPTASTIEEFAVEHGAIAAINGGFFNPENLKSTSYVVLNSEQVADPRDDELLVNNPQLIPYLDKIFNRTELRQYRCGQTVRYAIALHQEAVPLDCELLNALGGGPRLLPELTSEQEGFWHVVEGQILRDPLGIERPNARSAVGITREGDIILAMVAQQPEAPSNSGMTLPELAEFLKNLGAEQAMNLDGGGSASFYFDGEAVYGKVDEAGDRVVRAVKSVLLVYENS